MAKRGIMTSNSEQHPWEIIYQRDGRVFREMLPAYHRAVERFSKQQCHKILDLGCGNGRFVVGFSLEEFDVVGFDISPTGLSLTRDWLWEKNLQADLVCGDTRHKLPFQDNSFQGLFSTQVIHHALLIEIRKTIQEIWRVIKPGGLAFISVAGKLHQDIKYKGIEPGTYIPLEGDEEGLPHHIFTEAELRVEFSDFEILDLDPRDQGRVLTIWVRKPSKE